MARIIYVNGQYLPRAGAVVSCEDRGYQFADGVYEGFELRQGKVIDLERHLDRLDRSMNEIVLAKPPSRGKIRRVICETVRRNRYRNGFVYLQITRGVAPRDYKFPDSNISPAVVCIVYNAARGYNDAKAARGIKVITTADIRWERPDIKSLQLLPGVLARQRARVEGADEAWLIDTEGFVTEGAASNAWIIDGEGRLITRQTDCGILNGVTRAAVLDLIRNEGLTMEIRRFSLEEAKAANEAFITGSTSTVMPVVMIDEAIIGNGRPGPFTLRLRKLYRQRSDAQVKDT